MEALVEVEFLFDDCHEDINTDGDPDLRLHRIGRCAVKRFDAKMLFDPFEEKFDLPPAFVKLRNGQRGQIEIVGEKDEPYSGIGIDIPNPA